MAIDSEEIRVKQAEFLLTLFEKENGRPANDTEEIDNWMMSKSKEDRQTIRMSMDLYIKAVSEQG